MTASKNENLGVEVAVAQNDIETIKNDIADIKDKLDSRYITRLEGKAASWVIGIVLAILAIWTGLKSNS
jgi:hypothetical protein